MSGLDFFPGSQVDPAHKPNDRYTLRPLLDWCERMAGVRTWDLDVAACKEAHVAGRWYSTAQDGLEQSWLPRNGRGWNVWCNPPYVDLNAWCAKAWAEERSAQDLGLVDMRIAMLLPANRQEQPWWQAHVEPFRDREDQPGPRLRTNYPPGRQPFGHPGNPLGVGVNPAPFPVVLLVWWMY